MSDGGDHGDMEEVEHSPDDFFDHDPSKREKLEVRENNMGVVLKTLARRNGTFYSVDS